MTWLIGKIVSHPLVLAILLAASALVGFSAAWTVQGLRVTALKQEHTQYRQEQTQIGIDFQLRADKQREEAAKEYAKLQGELDAQIKSGEVYRRCVAAGRCGVRVQSCGPSVRLSASSGIDDSRAVAVPLAERVAEEVMPVVNDCAITTLRLNQLQSAIEAQDGYK